MLRRLFELSASEALTPERVHLAVQEAGMESAPAVVTRAPDEVLIHTQRGGIRGRGPNQKQYLHNIRTSDRSAPRSTRQASLYRSIRSWAAVPT